MSTLSDRIARKGAYKTVGSFAGYLVRQHTDDDFTDDFMTMNLDAAAQRYWAAKEAGYRASFYELVERKPHKPR